MACSSAVHTLVCLLLVFPPMTLVSAFHREEGAYGRKTSTRHGDAQAPERRSSNKGSVNAGQVDGSAKFSDDWQDWYPQDNDDSWSDDARHEEWRNVDRMGSLWSAIQRSDSGGYGGGGGGYGSKSIDLYSIFALGIFAAFLGYIVFYYISTNAGGGGARSFRADLQTQEYVVEITKKVLAGLQRWAL